MQIQGKIIKHLPTQSGEGSKGAWEKGGFIIEVPHDKFPKNIAFITWGDLVQSAFDLKVGTDIVVHFDVESREYKDRWFTDAKAFKIDIVSLPAQGKPNNTTISNDDDGFPF